MQMWSSKIYPTRPKQGWGWEQLCDEISNDYWTFKVWRRFCRFSRQCWRPIRVGRHYLIGVNGTDKVTMSKISDVLKPHFLQWFKPKTVRIDIHKSGLGVGMAKPAIGITATQSPPLEQIGLPHWSFNAMSAEDQKKVVARKINPILVSCMEPTRQPEAMIRINATDPSSFVIWVSF